MKLKTSLPVLSGSWLLIVLTLVSVTSGQAQKLNDKPNFTGTWVANNLMSDPEMTDLRLVILHNDPELKITLRSVKSGRTFGVLTYYTDGRGEINPVLHITNLNNEPKSKTKWQGKKLSITSAEELLPPELDSRLDPTRRNLKAFYYWTETWQLAKDGLLTQTILRAAAGADRASGPVGQNSNREVLKRTFRQAE